MTKSQILALPAETYPRLIPASDEANRLYRIAENAAGSTATRLAVEPADLGTGVSAALALVPAAATAGSLALNGAAVSFTTAAMAAGTITAPAITLAGDTGTGWWRSSSNTWTWTQGGSNRISLTSTRMILRSSAGLGWSSDPATQAASTLLTAATAAELKMGLDHATTPTGQTFKAHDVTTGTGAKMTIAGGTGSAAGGAVSLATSSTTGAPVDRLTVGADGNTTLSGSLTAVDLNASGVVAFSTNNATITWSGRARIQPIAVAVYAIGSATLSGGVALDCGAATANTLTIRNVTNTGAGDLSAGNVTASVQFIGVGGSVATPSLLFGTGGISETSGVLTLSRSATPRLRSSATSLSLGSGVLFGWNSAATPTAEPDTTISRVSAGVVGLPTVSASGDISAPTITATATGSSFVGNTTVDRLIFNHLQGVVRISGDVDGVRLGRGNGDGVLSFTDGVNGGVGTVQGGMSVTALNQIALGNGTQGSTSATVTATAFVASTLIRTGATGYYEFSGRARIYSSATDSIELRNAGNTADANLTVAKITATAIPVFTDDAAADADVTLLSGALYKVTGNRTIFQKP